MSELRDDLKVMAEMVPHKASVLDVGCGNGDLLAWLQRTKQIKGRGIEREVEKAGSCIERGLSVIQADAAIELPYFADDSFDIVILSRTLQAMDDPVAILNQVTRIGKQAIVAIPNFGYWRNRAYLTFKGQMPVTDTLNYEWYNTPNIHFCTIIDFIKLCQFKEITICNHTFHNSDGTPRRFLNSAMFANLFAEQASFLIQKNK